MIKAPKGTDVAMQDLTLYYYTQRPGSFYSLTRQAIVDALQKLVFGERLGEGLVGA